MHDLFKQHLLSWQERGLLRQRKIISTPQSPHLVADGTALLSFASNDYLGLASEPEVIKAMQDALAQYGAGSGSSAMVSGHNTLIHELELSFAQYHNLPKALHFSTGYMANLGVLKALALEDTAFFSDALNHASLIDGLRLSKGSTLHIYPHLDVDNLEQALKSSRQSNKWIVTDGVFSMDGDIAPLDQLLNLAERYDAFIYVDDAHGFGVLGTSGRGILEHFSLNSPRLLYMATLGKAMGVFGALVAGDEVLIDWIMQQSRTYIFTTGTPATLAAGALKALSILEKDSSYNYQLKKLIAYLSSQLAHFTQYTNVSHSAIHPLMMGESHVVMRVMEKLLGEGIWVPAIRPPTVPPGSARLRISLCANHKLSDIDRLVDVLTKVL
ncbi:MAG: 8-amino-7-oxononanoate synthase [Ferrovum sp. 37-45-19]|jgi:8-amino-7-oxononanoate synthase|nr:MAG: 8-amino-7-oxononanoate synthase [Ferrovum sp. 21-44-67]OYV93735.1 MAG: 8-amino-7-oxononanoate synthase [Ferrovum sp. 37-45-19]OZB32266.1 MAG: 8-amino-7-oxononanoate synthase [Ferrovum sp. 34-44-207]HQU06229.1 8-amino-7-oxononanoate synthase [Ferrovaceae bacterium]